jgi:tripartite ATP-independent transporter DctM subunit
MTPTVAGIVGIVCLMLVLFVTGMPVGFAMAIVGFCGFCAIVSFKAGLGMLSTDVWNIFSSYGLTTIPLFIFMGQIAFHSGANAKLYDTAYKWIGHIRGGMAMATVMACAGFAAICGSNAATAATMTTVALPQMNKFKYEPRLSTGTIACGSTLGVVIPPSVIFIIIGLSTGESIAKLFYGGMGAGIVLALLFMCTIYIICLLRPGWGPVGPKVGFKEKIASLPGSCEMLLLFFLVMLGLYFGFFTPGQAGAAGSFFALLIGLAQRGMTWKGFIDAVRETLQVSCMVIVIVAGATIFGRFLAVTRIPYDIAGWVTSLPVPNVVIFAIICVMYIFGGMVMDALALLLITIPIFFPVATQLGYDPIWFGVVACVLTTMGAVTPPVAATAYVVGGMAREEVPLEEVFKGIVYFLPAYIVCIIFLLLFPGIATFLPNLIK